ncbi:DHA2 family efflux MFS transporter permease subunit [Phytohabitans flavus]|uniref:MFS transporter n=1 Tax=Phytohabitans flavus TaxID=1076124 RepID=A0A6F8Y024_9ACTN|nr:MFS transporter [Phytohabitans flavus]BCB79389.1 MFS transporter [Phytohabitans flavus]
MSGGQQGTELRHSPWLVLATLCLGFFMILLDTTIVNIAIPDMSAALNASLDQILWIVNAYVLVYAVLLITAGRLGDLYGPKQLFIVGLVVFTLASAACGFANSSGQLVAARVVQGVGGALLTPQTLSVITVIFPPEKRGAAFGVWGGVAGVATVTGPTLGGYLVTDWGWEWIFFVNVPVGIVTVVLAAIVMPNLKLNRRHRLDWTGTLLASTGLFLITFGLIEGEPHHWGKVWGPITIPELIGAGVLLMVLFFVHQYVTRKKEPLVPFSIFSDRNFSLMNWVVGAIAFAMLGLFLPLVIYLQSVIGLSALRAGIAVAPLSLLAMVIAPFAGRAADRMGGKWILFTGLTLWSAGMALVVWLARANAGQWTLLPGLLIAGAGLGMTFAPLQTIAMRNIAPPMAGAASGLINTSRQLGGVVGSAAVGALLQARLATELPRAAREEASTLPEQYRQQFVNEFTQANTGSLHVGAGQTGVPLPPGLPEQARQIIAAAAERAFREGFTHAMRLTLILPLAVLAAAALSCLFIRGRGRLSRRERDTAPAAVGG